MLGCACDGARAWLARMGVLRAGINIAEQRGGNSSIIEIESRGANLK